MRHEAKITELIRKFVLGKMPINMSDARAEAVLAELQSRYDATEEGQTESAQSEGWIEDAPMCPAYAAKRSYQLR
jgi:hypothetical protein